MEKIQHFDILRHLCYNRCVPACTNSTFDNAFMTAEETYRYYNDFMWNGRYAECISMEEMLGIMKNGDERSTP